MESKSFEKNVDARPIPVYFASTKDISDEISLTDLWRVIAKRKATFLICLVLSALLIFAYLFFTEPVYKANTYLLPPQPQNIQELLIFYRGIEGIDINQYTPEYVYGVFLGNLRSLATRRTFFEKHELINHYTSSESAKDIDADFLFQEYFNKRLKVEVDKKDASYLTVSFSERDPELAKQWLNEIIDFTNKRTVHELVDGVTAAIQSEIGRVRYRLNSQLKLAEQSRLDRIISLKEALRIARTLGIKDASTFQGVVDETHGGVAVNTAELPLYMRGIGALEAEIVVLESRKFDEPFISGFRDLQGRLAFLEGVSVDPGKLSAVTVDLAARAPYSVDSPRKTPVIALGVILGVFAALFIVFLVEFLSKVRRGREESSA